MHKDVKNLNNMNPNSTIVSCLLWCESQIELGLSSPLRVVDMFGNMIEPAVYPYLCDNKV